MPCPCNMFWHLSASCICHRCIAGTWCTTSPIHSQATCVAHTPKHAHTCPTHPRGMRRLWEVSALGLGACSQACKGVAHLVCLISPQPLSQHLSYGIPFLLYWSQGSRPHQPLSKSDVRFWTLEFFARWEACISANTLNFDMLS